MSIMEPTVGFKIGGKMTKLLYIPAVTKVLTQDNKMIEIIADVYTEAWSRLEDGAYIYRVGGIGEKSYIASGGTVSLV